MERDGNAAADRGRRPKGVDPGVKAKAGAFWPAYAFLSISAVCLLGALSALPAKAARETP